MTSESPGKLLKAALDYARRGWPIFPCRRLDETEEAFEQRKLRTPEDKRKKLKRYKAKSPLVSGGCYAATSDQQQVSAWWAQWPDAMIAVATGVHGGIWVLDVDKPKFEGDVDGHDTLAALEAELGPLPDSVEQRTGSGGRQIFFQWPSDGRIVPNSTSDLGKNLDVRGQGGYVIIPPSPHPSGGEYAWVKTPKRGTKMVASADWLIDKVAKKPAERNADTRTAKIELDQEWNVLDAIAYLEGTAPPAIEGSGGDLGTVKVAMRLRDKGISEETALELMVRFYNERCEPPWDYDELAVKVSSAYKSAALCAPGGDTAEAAFDGLFVPPEDTQMPTTPESARPGWITYDEFEAKLEAAKVKGPLARCVSDITPNEIPARDWIMRNRFIPKFVTVTVAPGGGSKSTLSTLEAISVATGHSLTGMEVMRPGGVWLYNAEDPSDEIQRKFVAACMKHGLDTRTMGNLHYRSGQDERALIFVRADANSGLLVHQAVVEAIVKYITEHKILLMILDPFVRTHRVNENDNMQIDAVVAVMSRIANATGCAIHIVHHTRKLGKEGGYGDAETARGASSGISAARVAHTLSVMTEKEAEKFGVPQDKASFYVRLDDAKANFSAPGKGTVWFERSGVLLPNGKDEVGVLKLAKLKAQENVKEDKTQGRQEVLAVIAAFIPAGESKNLNEVVAHILADGSAIPFVGTKAPTTLRRKIEEKFLSRPARWGELELSIEEQEGSGANNAKTLVRCMKIEVV